MLKQLCLVSLTLLLVACATPQPATPAPTQQAIMVTYPSVLQAWVERLSVCASSNPLIAIYTTHIPQADSTAFSDEIVLSLGEPAEIDSSSSLWQVGTERIVVMVNTSNDQDQLSAVELHAIFSGQTTRWKSGTPIQVWALSGGDLVRGVFDQVVLQEQSISSNAMLAPDRSAMLEAISQGAGAIGYLPGSHLSIADPAILENVKSLQLETSLENKLMQPVIAVTQSEPHAQVRELLACLQQSQLNP